MVRYNNLRETVELKDIVNEDLGIFHGINLFFTSSRCTILVNLSMKTTLAMNPFDSDASVTRSVVT